jgi:uncharacterized membrane protein YqaE (UPF0057 family)
MLKGKFNFEEQIISFMMKRNWIVFAFALLALASCSVEKRVYQPGYHIEWNHFAKQDVSQGRSEGVFQGASQDLPQDLSENLETDVSQGLSENLETDVSQGRSEGVFQGAEQGRSEGVFQGAEQGRSEGVFQGAEQGRSEGVFQGAEQGRSEGASQDLPQDLSENLETDVSQDSMQSIDSDLEFVLLIILALFLPALTVFLLEGFSKNFWIALLLMAVAYLLPFSSFVVRGLIVAIATILAIAVVFHYM